MLDNLVDQRARDLLQKLNHLLEQNNSSQKRLNDIVEQISQFLNTDICSIYILQADNTLQLYATKGLNVEYIHKLKLRIGQGLVGSIALTSRPLNLADAQSSPNFHLISGLGEEHLGAFLGVPILRMGRCFGVLTIQNIQRKIYSDDELTALKISAIVLAELLGAGKLPYFSSSKFSYEISKPLSFSGVSLNKGLAIGSVILPEPRLKIKEILNKDSDKEIERLHQALEHTRGLIEDMLNRSEISNQQDTKDILEAYKMFSYDKEWINNIESTIRQGLSAEAAVEKERNEIKARFQKIEDPFLRERFSDFEDLSNRLLAVLLKEETVISNAELPQQSILIARSMSATKLLDYPRDHLIGLVLEDGSRYSHVTIVAKALDIPVISKIDNITALASNHDSIIVDGYSGQLHLRPSNEILEEYKLKQQEQLKKKLSYWKNKNSQSITKDGVNIKLFLNAGLLVDLPYLEQTGADGIGLLRTELQFMLSNHLPRVEQQEEFYRSILDKAQGKPVVFRTLDVGSDKNLSYFPRRSTEQNPALGWRATRLSLQRPALLRNQLRALLKAASNVELRVTFPLIAEISELRAVKSLLNREIEFLSKFNYDPPKKILVGSMIEVPSLLWQLDELFELVDFASIGSNDLFQFFTASDRCNALLNDYFDLLSGSFLRCLLQIIEASKRHQKPVTLCGEMANDPLIAMALIGLGLDGLSLNPADFGAIKNMIMTLNAKKLREELQAKLREPINTFSLRNWLEKFAKDNKVAV